MREGRCVVAVIPALNEEHALGRVLTRMPDWVDAVVVADNGSSDGTADVARRHGADVVREAQRGYGAACQAGVARLNGRMRDRDVVVFLDADGSDDPAEMAALVDPVVREEVDLVVGARLGRDRMPFHQRFGTDFVVSLLRFGLARRVTGAPSVSDLGPFRAIHWQGLVRLGMRDRGFAWTAEMQARALRRGLRIDEVPVTWRPGEGVSTISGTLRGSLRAGRDLSLAVIRHAIGMRFDRWRQRRPSERRRSESRPREERPLETRAVEKATGAR